MLQLVKRPSIPMKKNILIILCLTPLLSVFANTLVFKDGRRSGDHVVSLDQNDITTNAGQKIPTSSLRALLVHRQLPQEINTKDRDILRALTQNIKVMEDKKDRILTKKQTFIYNENKLWTTGYEYIQYISSVKSNKFEFEIKFNSNYEKVKINSLLYSTVSGKVKPFPEEGIKILSRSKENPQLKVLTIQARHFEDDVIIRVKITKEQFKMGPHDKLRLDCKLSDKLPVEHSEVKLNISQKNNEFEIKFKVSDQTTPVDYNIVKTAGYTSRQWIALNTPRESVQVPLILKITTIKQPRTKQISLYNKKLKDKIKDLTKTDYLKNLAKIDKIDQFLKRIRIEFKVLNSNSTLSEQTFEHLIKTRTGTFEDLVPMILAALERNKFRPELYRIKHTTGTDEDYKMVIKIEDNLYFLHQDIDRNIEWLGYCYYGYNIGAEIKIPPRHHEDKRLTVALEVNPKKNGTNGSLFFTIDHKFTHKEVKELTQQFPEIKITESKNQAKIFLPNRTQSITDRLLSFRVPDLNKLINFLNEKTEVVVKVILPVKWRVQRLPDDEQAGASYLPSLDGFVIKTVINKNNTTYQTPILLELISDEKRWFE